MKFSIISFKQHFKFSLLVVALFIGTTAHSQKDTLSFLHITDSHLMFNLENYNLDIVNHRENTKDYKENNSKFEQFMKTVPNKTKSDMIIHTGDMIDFYDAKTDKGEVLPYQVELFGRFIDQFAPPIYMTLGNHDIFSFNWEKNKNKVIPDQLKTGTARATWIRNFDCFRDGTYYSRTYEIGKTTYRLIFLDNSFYRFKKTENIVTPYIDKPQLHWLQSELAASSEDVEIILMHIPFRKAATLPESNNELYALLTSVPSVRLIFGGHYHKGSVMRFPSADGKEIIQIGTDALTTGADKWRLVHLTEDNILVSSMGITENELVIPIQ